MSDANPYKIEFYTTPKGESLVDYFLDTITEKHRGKIYRWFDYLGKEGPNLPRPYADIVSGKIRELRVAIARHQYRFLYFFHGKLIIMTHGFLKKTSKINPEEIERAQRAMRDWLNRYG